MKYYIIIRGPAGTGKTTVAKKLAEYLKGHYISFDEIMRENKLDIIGGDGISAENFLKANAIILPKVKQELDSNNSVVLDGCFYRKEQIDNIVDSLPYKHHVFSLHAKLGDCLSRNKGREKPMAEEAIRQVYQLVSGIEIGVLVETTGKTAEEVVEEIAKHINES